MTELYETLAKAAGYLGCVAIGALLSWYCTKKFYEKKVDEEINSFILIHERKDKKHEMNKPDKYDDNIEQITNHYAEAFKEAPQESDFSAPYRITIDDFESSEGHYEKSALDYYTEDGALVENGVLIDPDTSVGQENLDIFARRMDLVVIYIRNERTHIDYEITKYIERWND